MTCTAILQVTDRLGHAAWYWTGTYGGRHLEEIQAHPAHTFTDNQPGRIPVTLEHDGPLLGFVSYLEHGLDHNTDLRAVAVIPDLDADQVDGLMCSAEITAVMKRDRVNAESCTLTGLALVASTAGVGARPISAVRGDYRDRSSRTWNTPKILERALRSTPSEERWTRPKALQIHRPTRYEERTAARLEPYETYHRPLRMGPIEYSRHPGRIISVT